MPAPTTILVGHIGKVFWLRVEGRGTFQDSVQVKRAFQTIIAAGTRDLVVDLERCPMMDSTFLGTPDPRKNPGATLISEAQAGLHALEAMAGGVRTQFGKGGMITKDVAAKRAARSGAHTVIASGHVSDVILRLARGEPLGTLLVSETQPLTARKQWLADHLQLNGKLILDSGAIRALKEGKSLLPIGVLMVQGDFERGAAVACVSSEGEEVARGLTNYGSSDSRRIARHASQDIEEILGYIAEPEIIHRDNLILT